MHPQKAHWYTPLRQLESLGSNKRKLRNMGDLAAARRVHLSQFFTPDETASWMWQFVKELPITSILDNSIGSARLLQFADPDKHTLYGVDVHSTTVDEVKRVVSEAGFVCEILCAGMEDVHPIGMDCAIINPPFSNTLESTGLKAEPGFTRMGRLGPDTSATSDEYAVIQALKAARVVIALLPRSSAIAIRSAEGCWASKRVQSRLRGVFDLPAKTFYDENANVLTSVVVFGEGTGNRPVLYQTLETLNVLTPNLDLLDPQSTVASVAQLRYQRLDVSTPTITLPVTGDKRVFIALDGRKIKLRYFCGLVKAMVANAVLERQVFSSEHHRLPKGVHFDGQGKLDVEAYLLQDDPAASFHSFVESIRVAGGDPVVNPGVFETIAKKTRRLKRATIPLKHTIWGSGASNMQGVSGRARKTHNADPTKWISPVISANELVEFTREKGGMYRYMKSGKFFEINIDDLEANYVLDEAQEGWRIAHDGFVVVK